MLTTLLLLETAGAAGVEAGADPSEVPKQLQALERCLVL